MFQGVCLFNETKIHEEDIYISYVDKFEPEPLGKSTVKDFNPLAHIQIEEEKEQESEEDVDPYAEPPSEKSIDSKDN